MVGLSVILENHNYRDLSENQLQVIRKGSMMMMKPPYIINRCPNSPTTINNNHRTSSSSPCVFSRNCKTMPDLLCCSSGFLEYCFLCKQKLLPGRDIYMYKGEMAFCSEDCRYRQIVMDEKDQNMAATATATAKGGCTRGYNYCSLAATPSPSPSSSTSSNSSRSAAKGPRTARANNAFAY